MGGGGLRLTALAFLFFSLLRAIALVFGKAQANALEKRLETNRIFAVMIHAFHVTILILIWHRRA